MWHGMCSICLRLRAPPQLRHQDRAYYVKAFVAVNALGVSGHAHGCNEACLILTLVIGSIASPKPLYVLRPMYR